MFPLRHSQTFAVFIRHVVSFGQNRTFCLFFDCLFDEKNVGFVLKRQNYVCNSIL